MLLVCFYLFQMLLLLLFCIFGVSFTLKGICWQYINDYFTDDYYVFYEDTNYYHWNVLSRC